MQLIAPCLWFGGNAEEAVDYYISVFKDSKVLHVDRYSYVGPDPAAPVVFMEFQINGQPFQVNRLEDFGRAGNPELAAAGRQTYNRWLADFCAETPGRRACARPHRDLDAGAKTARCRRGARAGRQRRADRAGGRDAAFHRRADHLHGGVRIGIDDRHGGAVGTARLAAGARGPESWPGACALAVGRLRLDGARRLLGLPVAWEAALKSHFTITDHVTGADSGA